MKQLFIFTADWCSGCKSLKQILQSEIVIPVDQLRVFDVDTSANLAAEFGVMSIPTLILFENGAELARKTGSMTKQQFIDFCSQ